MTQALIRPARESDLEAMAAITATSYHEVDERTFQRSWPDPEIGRRRATARGSTAPATPSPPIPRGAGWRRSTAWSSVARSRGCAS